MKGRISRGLPLSKFSMTQVRIPNASARAFSADTYHKLTFKVKTDKSDNQNVTIGIPEYLAKIIKDSKTLNQKMLNSNPGDILSVINALDPKEKKEFLAIFDGFIEANKDEPDVAKFIELNKKRAKDQKSSWKRFKEILSEFEVPSRIVVLALAAYTVYEHFDPTHKGLKKIKSFFYSEQKFSERGNLTPEQIQANKIKVVEAKKICANKSKSLADRANAASIIASNQGNKDPKDIDCLKEIKKEIEANCNISGTEGNMSVVYRKLVTVDPRLPTLYAKILNQLGRSTIGNPTTETHKYFKDAIELRNKIDTYSKVKKHDSLWCNDLDNGKDIDDILLFQKNTFIAVCNDSNSTEQKILEKIDLAVKLKAIDGEKNEFHVNICILYEAKLNLKIAEKYRSNPAEQDTLYDDVLQILFGETDPKKLSNDITAKIGNIIQSTSPEISYYDRLLAEGGAPALLEKYKLNHQQEYLEACEQILGQIVILNDKFPKKLSDHSMKNVDRMKKEIQVLKTPKTEFSKPEAEKVESSNSRWCAIS